MAKKSCLKILRREKPNVKDTASHKMNLIFGILFGIPNFRETRKIHGQYFWGQMITIWRPNLLFRRCPLALLWRLRRQNEEDDTINVSNHDAGAWNLN